MTVRLLALGATRLAVAVAWHDGSYWAANAAAGAFGVGATPEAAVTALRAGLEEQCRWYLGAGRRLPLPPPLAERRALFARIAGETADV